MSFLFCTVQHPVLEIAKWDAFLSGTQQTMFIAKDMLAR